jgi:SAM-dependent methyltransferase
VHDLVGQREFWDAEADSAVFTHPLDVELLGRHVAKRGRILDFGCGYGRILVELRRHGFGNLAGLDASEAMVARARKLVPGVPVAVCDALPTPHPDASFEAVLLISVITCIPRDEDQRALMAEVFRLLAPGGVVYLSDFLLHTDERNLLRYRTHRERFGTFGVFEEGGAVFRHHTLEWIHELTGAYRNVVLERFPVRTRRGNPATGCRFLGRKPATPIAG